MTAGTIRVKMVSEAAEYVSVTHVVQRDCTLPELVEILLPVVGTDAARIQKMMRVGTVSTGEYRYRWEGLDVAVNELEAILNVLPHDEPGRPFEPQKCFLARFRRSLETLDLPREGALRKALFARQSFWEALMEFAARRRLEYAGYSHADKADRFTLPLDAECWQHLKGLLPLLKPQSAAARLEQMRPESIDLLTRR
ncbi:MAG TPA: hypothetical protein VNN17_02240 [Terriglobia bacterium]|nr:hypothetical protein [Terriglobia bacterium]